MTAAPGLAHLIRPRRHLHDRLVHLWMRDREFIDGRRGRPRWHQPERVRGEIHVRTGHRLEEKNERERVEQGCYTPTNSGDATCEPERTGVECSDVDPGQIRQRPAS